MVEHAIHTYATFIFPSTEISAVIFPNSSYLHSWWRSLCKTSHMLQSSRHFEFQSCNSCHYCFVRTDNWHVTDDDSSHGLNLQHVRFRIVSSLVKIKMLLQATCRVLGCSPLYSVILWQWVLSQCTFRENTRLHPILHNAH